MATLIQPDGTTTALTPADPKKGFTLDELRAAIGGGWIEARRAKGGKMVIVDEEGKQKSMPVNRAGSLAAWEAGCLDGVLVGPVLITEKGMKR